MPYIKQEHRWTVDSEIEGLLEQIRRHAPEDRGAILNYAVTRLLNGLVEQRYASMRSYVGDLQCCLMEFYRRRIAPYEDTKRRENGDVL